MVAVEDAGVGRDDERARIDVFLTGGDDEPRTLLLEGEPGIGKTTLWQAGVESAQRQGRRVLRAQPAESERSLSYAALDDLIRAVYDDVRDDLPAPQQDALDAALLRSAGTANARTIGSALVSVLAATGREQPVLVAVDDAQWLDLASAHALEFAARRLPAGVQLLLARRPEGPKLDIGTVERIELGPLSLAALHHVLRSSLGAAPARPTLLRIAATAGGNPFFALEIARTLDRPDELGGPLPVPSSLQELVADRIDSLSPAARDAALVVAALSRPTVQTVGVPPEVLAEAEAAGVLVVELDRIRFTHPLLASVVYRAAGGTQRLELHRRLADVVDDPDQPARHLSLCTTPPDETTAAELEAAAASAARRDPPPSISGSATFSTEVSSE
ncbi:MAG: AAA family ATPase, partial [Thermoleophilia bacterium]|nr:AAA family ATPase [Thermoleophilia bacterium]